MDNKNTKNNNKSRHKRLKARDRIVRDMINQERDMCIRMDLEKQAWIKMKQLLTFEEKKIVANMTANPNEIDKFFDNQISQYSAFEKMHIVRLEFLKEIRDGKKKLSDKEIKECVDEIKNSPSIQIVKK